MIRINNKSKFIHKISFLENLAKSEIDKDKWQEKLSSFAEIKPICDNRYIYSEGINFGNVISEECFIFEMRHIKGISADMRIKFRHHIYEIKRIIDIDQRGKFLNIIALEIV